MIDTEEVFFPNTYNIIIEILFLFFSPILSFRSVTRGPSPNVIYIDFPLPNKLYKCVKNNFRIVCMPKPFSVAIKTSKFTIY